jgi:hypothetical protein
MGQCQNTADARGDVRSVVTAIINMMELANQLQLKSPVPDDLAPYINNASSVAGEEELPLLPLIAHPLVEHARDDLIIRRVAHGLIQ